MVKDPHQYTNVAADPAYASLLEEARSLYQKRIREAEITLAGTVKKKKKQPGQPPKAKARE